MRGEEFIEAVKRRLERGEGNQVTDRFTAELLGITVHSLRNYRNRKSITPGQMVRLLFKTQEAGVRKAEREAIRPIVEFFKLSPTDSRGGVIKEIFSVQGNDGRDHPYLLGLRTVLERHHGIYIFHDSRGRALYAGKARKLKLWSEINKAYNRQRVVQQIRRVDHPGSKKTFRPSSEQRRQIRQTKVPLVDLAAYLSAYHVSDRLIPELESLVIRGFANDLLNVRMENFRLGGSVGQIRRKKNRRKHRA